MIDLHFVVYLVSNFLFRSFVFPPFRPNNRNFHVLKLGEKAGSFFF